MIFKENNKNIIFIHIPRTSGSYIEKQLCINFKVNIAWPKPNIQNLFGLYKHDECQHFTLQHLTLKEIVDFNFYNYFENNEDFIFTVIRNPYERIISLFNFFFKQFENNLFDKFLNDLIDLKVTNYNYKGIITTNKNFNCKTMNNFEEIKYFFIPQYYFIHQDKTTLPVNIFKFEEIEKINQHIPNIHLKFKSSNAKANQLNQKQKDMIYNLYQIDFDNLGFKK